MQKLVLAVILWAAMAGIGLALTVEERLVAGLEGQGYTVIEKGYTFLGRLRVVAESAEIHREIVVNPGTGEILRDYAIYLSDLPQTVPQAETETRHKSGRVDAPAITVASAGVAGPSPTGTAGVAAASLNPRSSTLGVAQVEVETPDKGLGILLDTPILPMALVTP